jgi:hypothetical protein
LFISSQRLPVSTVTSDTSHDANASESIPFPSVSPSSSPSHIVNNNSSMNNSSINHPSVPVINRLLINSSHASLDPSFTHSNTSSVSSSPTRTVKLEPKLIKLQSVKRKGTRVKKKKKSTTMNRMRSMHEK